MDKIFNYIEKNFIKFFIISMGWLVLVVLLDIFKRLI